MSPILTIALNPAIDLSSEAEAIHHTRKVRTINERYDPGGGGINVARVIDTLGGEAEALFAAGGETGAMLDRLLKQEGIRRRHVPIAGQTRISFMVREKSTGLEYRFVPKGPEVKGEELRPCLDAVAAHEAGYVVASGSLPAGAPADIYVKMAEFTRGRGARFVLDSSGHGLRETLERSRVFLVKPSIGELEQLVGGKLDEDGVCRAATRLVERGAAELVAVTMGIEGAVLASADGILRLPAIHVRERSAVGAGDSFLAAMTLALSRGGATEDAFRYGIAAGAAAVMTPGTELCRREDVERLYHCLKGP
ncbi:1-phosphofructokinase family hexose kinase [Chelativorans alearense]|uniref:1-phosphofructokinase family hexose kinase n=1 Tax=Chelativorans alearense TaxID=2681495 RepID=UPI0013D511BF|nr:1-phosphofructokinase family hexose kinase [Chelativorans alearense]